MYDRTRMTSGPSAPSSLASADPELRDLARDEPALPAAHGEAPTGLHLLRVLGLGAISTVFLAERRGEGPSGGLPPETPRRVALKLMRPWALDGARRMNQDPLETFHRERAALVRMDRRAHGERRVVRFYGEGRTRVCVGPQTVELPWLALELVDGGAYGTTLTERVERAAGGLPLARARALLTHLAEAVCDLHEEGIIHRDLKPDNVLLEGPPETERPKLADCGLARVDGLLVTVGGVTPAYGGPEQLMSFGGERNPLVGPWTDVHALAALAFFALAGEHWCRGQDDRAWHEGERRSLTTAARLSGALRARPELVTRFDAALARGATHGLPAVAWTGPEAARYGRLARSFRPSLVEHPPRYAGVRELTAALDPLFEEGAGG